MESTVSVIVPTFGKPILLEAAIQSVLSQTYENWELIVVDDNEPESDARARTEALMRSYASDRRIQYIKHLRNLNGATARNTGLNVASGQYVAFLDSDDEYMPERLQKCVAMMEKQPAKVGAVYTGCEFRRNGKTYRFVRDVKPGNYLVQALACTFMFCTGSNIFVRKPVIDELAGFDSRFLRHQDYEFLVRLFERYNIAAIPEALVIKNNENNNLPDVAKMIEIKRIYIDKYANLIEKLTDVDQNYIFRSHWLSIAELAQRSGDISKAREYYQKAAECKSLTLRERVRRVVLLLAR